MKQYENEEIKIISTPETVTIYFKKLNEILICENKYLVRIPAFRPPEVDKIG